MNSAQRNFYKQTLGARQTKIQVCVSCEKPIKGRIVWRTVGKVIRTKRPYHENCK